MSKNQVKILSDILIVEAFLAEPQMRKNGSMLEDIASYVEHWVGSKIDKDNPTKSIVDLLSPAAIMLLFKAFGWGRLGLIIGLAMNVLDINPYELLEPLCSEVKSMVSGGAKVSSSQIMNIAESAAQKATGSGGQSADDGAIYSSAELLRQAKMFNLAIIDFEHQNLRLMKNGFDHKESNLYKMAALPGLKPKGASLLGKVFGLLISLILGSLGLLVAGDMIRGLLGEKPAHQVSGPSALSSSLHVSTQTKYPSKGDNEPLPQSINTSNTTENIANIVVQFAKDVYSGLDGKESLIRSNPKFQYVVEEISWLNRAKGYSAIFMPKIWNTKKEMVDSFIDEVAASDK